MSHFLYSKCAKRRWFCGMSWTESDKQTDSSSKRQMTKKLQNYKRKKKLFQIDKQRCACQKVNEANIFSVLNRFWGIFCPEIKKLLYTFQQLKAYTFTQQKNLLAQKILPIFRFSIIHVLLFVKIRIYTFFQVITVLCAK